MKTTNQQLLNFAAAAQHWLSREQGKNQKAETKLKYAIERVAKRAALALAAFEEARAEAEIDLCSVDDRGNMLRDQFGLMFSKEARKQLNARLKDLLAAEVQIEPYLATEITPEQLADLSSGERECFQDFVLPNAETLKAETLK